MEIRLAQFQMDDGAALALKFLGARKNGQGAFASELCDAGCQASHPRKFSITGASQTYVRKLQPRCRSYYCARYYDPSTGRFAGSEFGRFAGSVPQVEYFDQVFVFAELVVNQNWAVRQFSHATSLAD